MADTVRIQDLGGDLPIPDWSAISWAECDQGCGSGSPLTTAEDELVFDGEPVVCPDCGAVGRTSVDDGDASVTWSDNRLSDVAFIDFRRLVGLPAAEREDAS